MQWAWGSCSGQLASCTGMHHHSLGAAHGASQHTSWAEASTMCGTLSFCSDHQQQLQTSNRTANSTALDTGMNMHTANMNACPFLCATHKLCQRATIPSHVAHNQTQNCASTVQAKTFINIIAAPKHAMHTVCGGNQVMTASAHTANSATALAATKG